MDRKIIGKLNIIDLFIITILILSVGALIYGALSNDKKDARIYTFTYICEAAPSNLLESVAIGGLCMDAEDGTDLGVVTFADTEVLHGKKSRGTIIAEAKGTKKDHGVDIRGSLYLKGKKLNLIVGDSVFEVYISEIK